MMYPRPFTAFPGIVQRSVKFVDLQVYDRPEVTSVRLWGSGNLTDAYGTWANSGLAGTGGTAFAEAARGTSYVSPTLSATQLVEESRKRMTRFYFNPEDYAVPMPADDQLLFVRSQEAHLATGGAYLSVPLAAVLNAGNPIQGPIRVVPPASFWLTSQPAVSLAGTAPSNTGCTLGAVPPLDETLQVPPPMLLVLPGVAKIVTIQNNEAPGVGLLIGAGLGSLMTYVDGGNSAYFEGNIKEIVLARAAGAGGCRFSIYSTYHNEYLG